MASPTSSDRDDQVDVLALIDHFIMGGAETMLTRFALAARRAGIRLSIAFLEQRDGNPAAAPLLAAGMAPTDLGLPGRPGLHGLRVVRSHIQRLRPQVVHTHLGAADLLGSAAARSLGVPAVNTLHTTQWSHGREEIMSRFVSACTARTIAVSESARHEYVRRGLGREEKVVTIHNGLDVVPIPGAGADVRRELGLAADDLVVAMVSALRSEKAHDVAIDAVDMLMPRFPNLRLLIVGQGAQRDEIARRSAALGRAVVMAGQRPDVMAILDAADICLHPSLHEALPATIIEAMAARTPVVATATGGIPEIITGSELGVLIAAPPTPEAVAGALAGLIEAPQRRRELGAAGQRAYEERFTAGPWLERTRALYDEIIAEGARQRLRPVTRGGRRVRWAHR